MKKVLLSLIVGAIMIASPAPAWATPISITGLTDPRLVASTDINSNLGSYTAICAAFFPSGPCPLDGGDLLYYKSNVDDGEEDGSLKTSYAFTPTGIGDDGASGGTITYAGAPNGTATCPNCYLIVKDGRNTPAQFLFTLNAIGDGPGANAAWDGTSTITLSNFWYNTEGAISNVAVWGEVANTTTSVPDGGSVPLLFGGALVAVVALRRYLN